jgi:hypothetical protein
MFNIKTEYNKTEEKSCGCSKDFHRGVILGLCISAIVLAIVAIFI